MRISAFRVLASSLAFNSVAVASACKPRSSAPIPLSLSTSEALSYTSISASTTVVTYDASTTSGVSLGTTTSEVVVSTDESSSTRKDTAESPTSTETLSTTTVAPDSSITTTEVPTPAFTATSWTTTSDAALPSFIVSPFRPPFNGQPMLSNRVTGNLLYLSVVNKPEYTAGVFTIDPESGHLLLDNKQPICAIYGQDDSNPWLEVCPRFLAEEEVMITCQIVDSELESSDSSSFESVAESATSSLTLSSASSAALTSTETDVINTEATTVVESASTLEVTANETATTEVSTTEASTAEITATSGTISESIDLPTTVDATTAVPSNTAVPLFRVTAQSGPTGGQTLLADRNGYAVLLYDNSEGDFSDAFFAVDPVTHYLMLDNKQPICGYFGDNNGLAYWVRCDTSPTIEQAKLTCEIPTSTGEVLECRVPEIICDNDCVPTGETWSFTYTNTWGLGRWSANLGPESQNGGYKTALIVEFLD
ncbi:unnamed protein product [Fusarium graminearum]|nr:unnamed protein product [Fusarium graminearum]